MGCTTASGHVMGGIWRCTGWGFTCQPYTCKIEDLVCTIVASYRMINGFSPSAAIHMNARYTGLRKADPIDGPMDGLQMNGSFESTTRTSYSQDRVTRDG